MTVKQFIVCMCGLFVHSKHTWKKQNKKVRACIYVFKDFVMLFFFPQEYSPKPWKELTETVFLL